MTTMHPGIEEARTHNAASAPRPGNRSGRLAAAPRQTNVGENERAVSVASGAILAIFGASRRSLPGLVVAGIGASLIQRGVTGTCAMYSALGIDTAQHQPRDIDTEGFTVTQTFTIDRPREDLYSFWRNFENLPRVMSHVKEVQVLGNDRSHWVAQAPSLAGGTVEWDAVMTFDEGGSRIGWESLPGSEVDTAGSVTFTDSPRGTIVRVRMQYLPPAGRLGKWVAMLTGNSARHQIREDLRAFKRLMETGEVPTIEGQPRGTCAGFGLRSRSK